jgi:P27 family predicted phage terminase small subunit
MAHHTRGAKAKPKPLMDAVSKVPKPPTDMSAEGREEWRRVMPVLVDRRVLSPADMAAVERYCEATGDVKIARARIKLDGDYVPNRLGELKRHPAFVTLKESTSESRRWAAELGLTPASRSRVAEGDDDAGDSLMD